jgi:hypothetical protein
VKGKRQSPVESESDEHEQHESVGTPLCPTYANSELRTDVRSASRGYVLRSTCYGQAMFLLLAGTPRLDRHAVVEEKQVRRMHGTARMHSITFYTSREKLGPACKCRALILRGSSDVRRAPGMRFTFWTYV